VKPARLHATRRRLAVARSVLLLAFLTLAARAADLSLFDERGSRLAVRQSRTALSLAPERGLILDRSGHALALSAAAPSVYAVPEELDDPARAASALDRALGLARGSVAQRLQGRRHFAFVARWVGPERAERVRALDLRGVGIVEEPRRVYPYKELGGALLGFANIDGKGVRGIEQQEDEWLRGRSRRLPAERDGSGRLLVDRGDEHWHTAGGDVALTLDVAMQADARRALAEAVERTGARGGAVVVLDPSTGDVLALAEWPGFDPNRFREVPYAETRSRAFLDAMEPGSTLKAFLVAAALESQTLRPEDLIDCENGSLELPGKTITDHHPHGQLHPDEILRISSNVGAVKIAFRLGIEAHVAMLRRFGFGAPTGSGFPDESAGVLRTPARRRPVEQATLAFGQGLGVTPIQLAAATAALANGGELVRPRLVSARRAPGGRWQALRPERVQRVVSERTATTLLGMLEGVTSSEGTGRRAALRGLRVAGKTGTAQKFDASAGRYSTDRFVAWFIGVAPADAPRLAITVALDEPRRPTHTGGAAAAPLFARVASAQLARLGILTEPQPAPPSPKATTTTTVAAAPRPVEAQRKARPVPEVVSLEGRVLLPDLRGLTVAEVKAVSERARLAVQITGRGRAVDQSPPPGTVVAASAATIQVRCEPGVDPI
jgi:cell division protein FtsI (penicillin-binding protein 3)